MNIEKSMNYKERRVFEQLQQVLNLRTNCLGDDKNVSELFANYKNSLQLSTQEKKSLTMSELCYTDLRKINLALTTLKKNDPESFLIVNFKGQSHMFSSVVRIIDDSYSLTVVNRGQRSFRNKYIECLFNGVNAANLSLILKQSQNRCLTSDIYRALEISSDKHFNLLVDSPQQKGLNCFIKEPESGIKYALSTSKMSNEELINLRDIKKGIFLNPFDKPKILKPKWPNAKTLDIHEKFFLETANKNPSIKRDLTSVFNVYRQNKNFRKLIKEGASSAIAFEKAFLENDTSKKEINQGLLSKYSSISIETTIKNQKDIVKIIRNDNNPPLAESLNVVIKLYKQMKELRKYRYGSDDKFSQLERMLKEKQPHLEIIDKNFPFLMYQIKGEIAAHLFIFTREAYKENRNNQKAIDRISFVIKQNPLNPTFFRFRGDIYKILGKIDSANMNYTFASVLES